MAEYTIELGALIESGFDIWDYPNPFPIFDESYREPLQKYIENYFYDNEIGFETGELFRKNINRSLIAIMPYYNQLLEAASLKLGDDVLTSRGENSSDTHTITKDGNQDVTNNETVTDSSTRTDDLQMTLEHDTQSSTTGNSDVTTSNTRTDNLQDNSEYTTNGETDNTTTHNENTKNYEIPVSGTDNGFDPKYMHDGSTTGSNDTVHTSTSGTDHSEASHTGTQKNDGTQETTSSSTVTDTGTDTTKNTGTQKNEGNTEKNGTGNTTTHEHTVDEYVHTLTAYDAPKFELLARLRQTFININQMICEDDAIWNCFMHIL